MRRRAERKNRGAGAERRMSASMTVDRTVAAASGGSRNMFAFINYRSAVGEEGRRILEVLDAFEVAP